MSISFSLLIFYYVIKCVQIRYAEHLPSVLKNITCTFPGRKKVGVVGRTGSGKSTLIQAIFRIVEPREGSIIIDNVDICKIGLHDLRSRLSIIPQDPALFEGTVRGNLDPLQKYSDIEVWEVNNLIKQLDQGHENGSQCVSIIMSKVKNIYSSKSNQKKIFTDCIQYNFIKKKKKKKGSLTIKERSN